MSEILGEINKSEFVSKIFESYDFFENNILGIETPKDRKEVVLSVVEEVLYESSLKQKVNFCFLYSYNNFSLKEFPLYIMHTVLEQVLIVLKEDIFLTDDELKIIKEDKVKVEYIYKLCLHYFKTYKEPIMSMLAKTLFELADQANDIKEISQILKEAVLGTAKHRSLVLKEGGIPVISKADQLWMRIKQANKEKKSKIFALEQEIKNLKMRINSFKENIDAIAKSKKLYKEDLEAYTLERLRDVFTNKDAKSIKERRILSFVPAGSMAYILEHKAEKGVIASKFQTQKDDFQKIMQFFEKCKFNNTAKQIDFKLKDFEKSLLVKQNILNRSNKKLEKIFNTNLENFDPFLQNIKKVIIRNLATLKSFYV